MFSRGICRVKESTALEPWEFGHKRGEREIKQKKLQNKNTSPFQLECKLRKPSIFCDHLSWEHTYIFSLHNYNLLSNLVHQLNAEFQHFILRFHKNLLTWGNQTDLRLKKEFLGGERRSKDRMKTGWLYWRLGFFFLPVLWGNPINHSLKIFSKDPISPVILFYSDFYFLFLKNLGIVGALILKLFKNPELKVTSNKIKGPPNTGLNF
jgi:hypothetical protein